MFLLLAVALGKSALFNLAILRWEVGFLYLAFA